MRLRRHSVKQPSLAPDVQAGLGGGDAEPWVNIPFDAANFYGMAGMTWTVAEADVSTNRYGRVGNIVTWTCVIGSSILADQAKWDLGLAAPTKARSKSVGQGFCNAIGPDQLAPLLLLVGPMSPEPGFLRISRPGSALWVLGTLSSLSFTITYEAEE